MFKQALSVGICFIAACQAQNYVVVHAASHALEVYDDAGALIHAYPVGIGKNGPGKTKSGDCKTPIGEYYILWKASRYAETDGGFLIAEGQAYCGKDNAFYREPQNERGSGAIWVDDYGGAEAVFMCLDYPNSADLANGYTGNGIAIHAAFSGVGESSSAGCIRMTPPDARDLYNRVGEGCAVFITDD